MYGALCTVQPSKVYTYYCPTYTTIYNTVLGFNLFTPSLKLNYPDSPFQQYYFNASFNKQRQWDSLPHYIDNTNTTLTVSRQFNRALHTYVSYQIQNIGDHYIDGGYEQRTQPHGQPTAYCPNSFTSFRGVATLRTTSFGTQRHADAGFQPLGARPASPGSQFRCRTLRLPRTIFWVSRSICGWQGQPPYDATADVRFKILPHTLADISRTLYWYGDPYRAQYWQQNFVIQLLPMDASFDEAQDDNGPFDWAQDDVGARAAAARGGARCTWRVLIDRRNRTAARLSDGFVFFTTASVSASHPAWFSTTRRPAARRSSAPRRASERAPRLMPTGSVTELIFQINYRPARGTSTT